MSPLVATRASASARAFGLMSASQAKAQYIAASSGSNIASSVDAVTWTQRYGPGGVIRVDAEHNGTMWVIVGNSGSIETSLNGISWTSRTSGTSQNLISVNWLNSTWVVVGANGYIGTSTDGVTWTSRTSGTTSQLIDSTYGGGTYYVLTADGNFYYSTNLSTWTAWTMTTAGYSSKTTTIGTYLLAVVTSLDSAWTRIYRATLGTPPTGTTYATATNTANQDGSFFKNRSGTVYLVGKNPYSNPTGFYSTNGSSWTSANGWATSSGYMVGYGGAANLWISANLNDVQTATTLGTWTTRSLPFSNIYVAQGAK